MYTIIELLKYNSEKFSNALALVEKNINGSRMELSYRDVWEKVRLISAGLITLGLSNKDKIAVLSENRAEWGICFLSILKSGGICVGIDTGLSSHEIFFILNDSEAKYIFISSKFLDIIKKLYPSLTSLKKIICFETTKEEGVISLDELIEIGKKEGKLPDYKIMPEDIACLVYTSGTTGRAKGVLLSHKNLTSNIYMVQQVLECDYKDNFLSLLPLSHMFELTGGFLYPISIGATIFYIPGLKTETILNSLKDSKITIVLMVPAIIRLIYKYMQKKLYKKNFIVATILKINFFITKRLKKLGTYLLQTFLYKIKEIFPKNFKYIVSGGAPLDKGIIEWFDSIGITILQGYGLTETSPIISVNTPEANKIGSVGKPLPGVEIKIADRNKENIGEVIVKGENVMVGYFRDEKATGAVLQNGWFRTGDLGWMDKDGFLYITGRWKNVIVTETGRNIYPEEIEQMLLNSSYIKEVCVIGLEQKRGEGEEVYAIIIPDKDRLKEEGISTEKSDIENLVKREIKQCSKKLASYKKVRRFQIWEKEFPYTASRKIRREVLRKLLVRR